MRRGPDELPGNLVRWIPQMKSETRHMQSNWVHYQRDVEHVSQMPSTHTLAAHSSHVEYPYARASRSPSIILRATNAEPLPFFANRSNASPASSSPPRAHVRSSRDASLRPSLGAPSRLLSSSLGCPNISYASGASPIPRHAPRRGDHSHVTPRRTSLVHGRLLLSLIHI